MPSLTFLEYTFCSLNRAVTFEVFPELELLLFFVPSERCLILLTGRPLCLCLVRIDYDRKSLLTPVKNKISLCNNSTSNSLFFSSLTCGCYKGAVSPPCCKTDKCLSALLSVSLLSPMMSSTCVLVSFCLFVSPYFLPLHPSSLLFFTGTVPALYVRHLRVFLSHCLTAPFCLLIKHLKSLPYKLKQVHLWFHGHFNLRIQPSTLSSTYLHFISPVTHRFSTTKHAVERDTVDSLLRSKCKTSSPPVVAR